MGKAMQSSIRNILHLNVWPDFDDELPRGARHFVNHDLNMSVTVTEGFYLHETNDRHALWSVVGPRAGVVITAERSGSVHEAARDFFEILMRAQVGYAWSAGVTRPGLIDEASYNAIVDKVTAELDSNAVIARSLPSDIITAAERLSLHPEPTGRGPHGPSARPAASAIDATPMPAPNPLPYPSHSPGHESDPNDRPGAVATIATVPTVPMATAASASGTPSKDELHAIDARLSRVDGVELLVEVWEREIVPLFDPWLPPFVSDALTIYRRHQRRLTP